MYSAFYIQPKVEKEKRIVRCDPFVKKYTVAVFILRVERRKGKMGGVLVGEVENLKKCWEAIEQADGSLSDSMDQVMRSVSEIAAVHKCAVVFQQPGDEATFSSQNSTLADSMVAARENLDSTALNFSDAGVFSHVSPTEYYDVERKGDHVVFRVSRFAVGSHPDVGDELADKLRDIHHMDPRVKGYPLEFPTSSKRITTEIQVNPDTQDRFLLSSCIRVDIKEANDVVVDCTNRKSASELFRRVATSGNVFIPKNTARGTLTKVGTPTSDAAMYDITMEHSAEKILPLLETIFNSDRGVRGIVVASWDEPGQKDKLFLLKGSDMTSEATATERCWAILKEMYQEEGEGAAELKKPEMKYFKFRV